MHTAVGFPVLIRSFRLALTVEGLRPHTIDNYIRDVERFTTHFQGRKPNSISASDVRDYIAALHPDRAPKTVHDASLPFAGSFVTSSEKGRYVATQPAT